MDCDGFSFEELEEMTMKLEDMANRTQANANATGSALLNSEATVLYDSARALKAIKKQNSKRTIEVFISQPMSGRSDDEIIQERNVIADKLREIYKGSSEVEIVESFFAESFTQKNSPLRCLAKSIACLSHVDVAVFAPGWGTARGCRIEHTCAVEYNVPILYID